MKRSNKEIASLVNHAIKGAEHTVTAISAGSPQLVAASDARKRNRRQSDDALQKSEERYRTLVEHSSEAVWCVEIEPPCPIKDTVDQQIDHFYKYGFLAECNDAMAQMFGFPDASRIVGASMSNLLPRSVPGSREYLKAFIQSGYRLADEELHELDREGNVKCFLNNLVGIIEDGALARAWGTKRDITQRKMAEDALRESEERYERLVALSPDAIIVHTDGEVSFCNTAAAQLVGASSTTELIGRSVFDFVTPDSLDMMRSRIARIHNGESLPALGFKCLRLDGSTIDVEMQSVSFGARNGSTIQAVIRDISDRKLAEAALQEANQRAIREYERLMERIAMLGQTLGQARELQSIFRALREFTVVSVPCDGMVITLYEPEENLRRPTYCWVDGAELETSGLAGVPVRDGMTGRAIKSGEIVIDNEYQRNVTGKAVLVGKLEEGSIPQSALAAPMAVRGRTVGCVEIQSYQSHAFTNEHATAMRMAANLAATAVENVELIQREREKAEQLRQSQKMEAVGQLAGGVAHDFNNLLTVITGYSEIGLRRMAATDPMRRNMEEIKKAGDRAASLTRQLLAFSRKQMFQAKVIDLNLIVADMDTLLQRLIGEDIDLVTLLEPSLCKIKADPGQIEQVLMNLVVNARDAMPRGGNLTIETGNAVLDQTINSHVSFKPGRYLMLAVSDTGIGMDAETQKRIFEPFFTTKEVGKGTGLGLATVYGIVKQSDGNILVYSEPGHGTTFKIYLPVADEFVNNEIDTNVSEVPRGHGTVLLVEDEELVRNLAGEILQANGYDVLTAANGVEALRVSAGYEGNIDLLITDVVMPQMGGRELAERLAELRPKTKVLYMSGYTDDAIVRHGILDDRMSFIQKPFSLDLFALKVRQILDPPEPAAS
ncbi:MAG: PAS domain S-box protein [Pyrinomonadaceae bacterium]|nr:PAS domain S-box protein [Pyrinomonadaceae bacterium]